MLYWDYPGVESADRLAHSPALDPAQVQLGPAQALARLETAKAPDLVRLNTFQGRPVYRFSVSGEERMVFADTGELPNRSSRELGLATASAWTGQPAGSATLQLNAEEDQWTVPESFRPLRPLWKYSWPNGEQVYVSQVSGEVVQHTTRSSRLKAYLGPIPHWLYFTPLRKHEALWSNVVIWASGLATLAALLGLIVGIWAYSPSRRISIPYSGPKRWHMILGLFFGIVACTWSFSGMLSMDPFPVNRDDSGASALGNALQGTRFDLAPFEAKSPREALAQIGSGLNVKQLDLTFFAGEAVYLATDGKQGSRIVPIHGPAREAFDLERLLDIIRAASQPAGLAELSLIHEYDAYYLDRGRQKPLPVILARMNDREGTRYYIDPRTARIVFGYSSRFWVSRWLYHGLHSLELPWLYDRPALWNAVMLTLLLGGSCLSGTAVILGWRFVRRRRAQ